MIIKNTSRKYGMKREIIYELADWTDDTAAVIYLGYLTDDGGWIIKKIDTTARTVRYSRGKSAYPTAWGNKASESTTYGYLNEVC